MEQTAINPEFLMCPADYFEIRYEINAWMEGNTGRSRLSHAREQWRALHEQISRRATVRLMRPASGLPDLVFTANAGLVIGKKAVLGRFRYPERRPEEPLYRKWFEENGYEVFATPPDLYFEGAGDALTDRVEPRIWMGYGFRSVLEAADWVAQALGIETVPLRLVDQRFYHLDTCLLPLGDGSLMYYPGGFDERSRRRIEELVPESRRIEIDERDALDFACNAVQIDGMLVMHRCSPTLAGRLSSRGLRVIQTPLDQFILAGGSARCLCLRLDESAAQAGEKAPSELVRRTMTIEGHLFDNGILVRAMDLIAGGGGSFETLELRPGQRREDHSFARLAVSAPNAGVLEPILAQLLQLGARIDETTEKPARLAKVEIDGVSPDDFYCTTIHHTDVLVDGHWVPVTQQRMDGVIVVDRVGPRAAVSLIRDLRKGQEVVVGVDGLRVIARSKPAGERQTEEFAFMSSAVSSERRVELAVDAVAWEMVQIRKHGGRIVLVAGPVVVHTGGIPALCELARMGFISAVLSGNALATHDIELALYGTSLGVDYQSGLTVHGGHRHHLRAINMIRKCGSIADAVAQGVLKNGFMYELVKNDIPFCLAGSIRDDGPLPETMMDLVAAQGEYQRLLAGAEMVLMLSSMLHSIGVGNMTPGGVRLVCVDINPAVATKLADRGSLESRSIVTDVGLFLTMLLEKVKGMPE
ncbi:TIGR00300 family protein [bacterium]|nr:TIGR00300 family protein [bacterium]